MMAKLKKEQVMQYQIKLLQKIISKVKKCKSKYEGSNVKIAKCN